MLLHATHMLLQLHMACADAVCTECSTNWVLLFLSICRENLSFSILGLAVLADSHQIGCKPPASAQGWPNHAQDHQGSLSGYHPGHPTEDCSWIFRALLGPSQTQKLWLHITKHTSCATSCVCCCWPRCWPPAVLHTLQATHRMLF